MYVEHTYSQWNISGHFIKSEMLINKYNNKISL